MDEVDKNLADQASQLSTEVFSSQLMMEEDLSLLQDNHGSHTFFIETEDESEVLSEEDPGDQAKEDLIMTIEEARNQLS